MLRDEVGKYLVIALEQQISDSALRKILRLNEGFELDHPLSRHSVRPGIVCYRAYKNVLATYVRAGVEVWIFHLD